MATVPPPSTIPDTPVTEPAGIPDEVSIPGPDVDVPDVNPGDPGQPSDLPESAAHPS